MNRYFTHSLTGTNKQLPHLLQLYGDITVVSGILCHKCRRKLLVLYKNVLEFKNQCQKNISMTSKRCLASPVEHIPQKKC